MHFSVFSCARADNRFAPLQRYCTSSHLNVFINTLLIFSQCVQSLEPPDRGTLIEATLHQPFSQSVFNIMSIAPDYNNGRESSSFDPTYYYNFYNQPTRSNDHTCCFASPPPICFKCRLTLRWVHFQTFLDRHFTRRSTNWAHKSNAQ